MARPIKALVMTLLAVTFMAVLTIALLSENMHSSDMTKKDVDNLLKARDSAVFSEFNTMISSTSVHGSNIYKVLRQDAVNIKRLRVYDSEGKLQAIYGEGIQEDESRKMYADGYRYFMNNSWKIYDVSVVKNYGVNYWLLISELTSSLRLPKTYEDDITADSSVWD